MTTGLSVLDLAKRHGATRAVASLSFTVGAGQILGLLGPNGAGKTTTIEAIAGLIDPDEGRIEIGGVDARAEPLAARRKLGVVLQSTGLQDKITPREALALFARLHGAFADPSPLLMRFGLGEKADAYWSTLSGGQRQRLALALAFVGSPEVVLLDEPSAGLDPHMRREMHDHVRAMRIDGRAILLATHDMAEAEQLCDRIVVLDRGRLVAEGTTAELLGGHRDAIHVRLQASDAPAGGWPAALDGLRGLVGEGIEARFVTGDLNRAMAQIVAFLNGQGIALVAVDAGRTTLEDLILERTGTGLRE